MKRDPLADKKNKTRNINNARRRAERFSKHDDVLIAQADADPSTDALTLAIRARDARDADEAARCRRLGIKMPGWRSNC